VSQHGELITVVGEVRVPDAKPPAVLLAALGPQMLRLARELADGTITWMTGPRTLADHVIPTITSAARAAGRPSPRIVAGSVVCVTDDAASARARIGEHFGLAGQVPEYRAVLDREGAAGPADVAIIGDEEAVIRAIRWLADIGVSELIASPFGTADEQARTIAVAAELVRTGGLGPS
jgi:alkanesulfonate monooxygenase SsuD/methylene tetrahydromethanopterin reductase-like flavin-dependent oxidoreductase (luciferase family)